MSQHTDSDIGSETNSDNETRKNSIYEKIKKRNDFVGRNSAHLKYMNASSDYDTLKLGFYTAVELAVIDESIPISEIQRYQFAIKDFDKKLLYQMKDRGYDFLDISDEENDNSFNERIRKIKVAGHLRNKLFFEFCDEDETYKTSKNANYKEILLAHKDGLITEMVKIVFERALQNLDKQFVKKMEKQKNNFHNKREDINVCNGYDRGQSTRGRQLSSGNQSTRGTKYLNNWNPVYRNEYVRNNGRGERSRGRMSRGRSRGKLRGGYGYSRNFNHFNSDPY